MTEQAVLDIGARSVWVALKIASAPLIATLLVGLLVSIFQAATQINEQTMSFIPKILGMTAACVFFGPWILEVMIQFTLNIFKDMPTMMH